MKKKILLFTLFAGFSTLIISSYKTGPAANGYDCTGAETAGSLGNPTGCTTGHCHNATATTGISVGIVLDSAGVATTHYTGGQTYTVTITGTPGTATTNTYYGFQLNALKGTASAATNANAGIWATTGLPTNTHVTGPGTYTQLTCVEHSTPLHMTGSSFSESFKWTAPAIGTGAISFWGAANFVNDNGNADNGDLWNTTMVIINEWSSDAGIANVSNSIHVKAFPNPVINNLGLQMDNTQAGTYAVYVFDMNGRIVFTENIAINGTSHTENINTANWLPSNYHVVVEKDGYSQVIPIVKL